MHKDSLTDDIRRRVEGYHETPDDFVWQNLEQQLDRRDLRTGTSAEKFFTLRTFSYVLWSAVVVLLSVNILFPRKHVANANHPLAAAPKAHVVPKTPVETGIDGDRAGEPGVFIAGKKVIGNKNLITERNDRSMKETQQRDVSEAHVIVPAMDTLLEKIEKQFIPLSDTLGLPLTSIEVNVANDASRDEPHERGRRPRSISFYSSFTPSLNYFTIKPSGSDAMVVSGLAHIPVASSQRTSYQADVGLQCFFGDRITAYGGLSYQMQNIKLNYQYFNRSNYSLNPGASPGDYNISPVFHTGSVTYAMRNIGVQIGALCRLQGERLSHHAGIGLTYQHGVKAAPSDDSYHNYRSYYAFVQALYRVEYKVNPMLSVFAQPNFTQAIFSKEELAAPFVITPYKVGLGFGAVFTVRK